MGRRKKELVQAAPEMIQLKPRIEKFCQIYARTGIATTSYCEAYGIDKENLLGYMGAAANASRLLKNDKVAARINQMLTLAGFTPEGVDIQLNFLVQQQGDLKTKLGAIREANALFKRTGANKQVFKGNTFNLTSLLDQANAPQATIEQQA